MTGRQMDILYKLCILIGTILILSLFRTAHAEVTTETAEHTLADNETRQMAVSACVLTAEKQALEASGTLVDSEIDMSRSDTSSAASERVLGVAAGITKGKLVYGSWGTDGGDLRYTCTVEVTFSADDARRVTEKIAQARVGHGGSNDAIAHMDYLTARAKTLRVGMNHHEVAAYMGEQPRAVDESRWLDITWWNYGSVWVALWHSSATDAYIVQCLAPDANMRACWSERQLVAMR